ncbi:MAG: hypothetical protein R3Y36_07830, partial [Spirochaetales bacterium]
MKKAGIALRLSIVFSMLIAICLLGFSVFTLYTLRHSLRLQNDEQIVDAAEYIQNLYYQSNQISAIFETNIDLPWYILFTVYKTKTSPSDNTEHIEIISTNDAFLPLLDFTGNKTVLYHQKDYFLDGDLNILYYTIADDNITVQTALDMDTNALLEAWDVFPGV